MQEKSSHKEESSQEGLAVLRTELATLSKTIAETEKCVGIEVPPESQKDRLDGVLLSGILAQRISDVRDMQRRMYAICEEAIRLHAQLA